MCAYQFSKHIEIARFVVFYLSSADETDYVFEAQHVGWVFLWQLVFQVI